MMRPIAISLSPNTTRADVRRAWHTLLRPRLWGDTSILPGLATQLSQRLNGRPVVFTSSGRQALYDLLRALGIGSGDEVIIQAFTCIAVPEPIIWAGATPIYADINPRTYNLDIDSLQSKITDRTKAIIVQHTFGLPAPLDEIMVLAREKNIKVIEDCAHAFGATYKDQPVGTFGDAAILSFGRDKVMSSVFGGAVVSDKDDLIKQVKKYAAARPQPPARWIIQQLWHPIAMSFILPIYFMGGIGKAILVLLQDLNLLSKAVEEEERQGQQPAHLNYQFSPALAQLLEQQLQQLGGFLNKRRDIAARYLSSFSGQAQLLPDISTGSQPAWLRFPLAVGDGDTMRRAARQHSMLLGDWYDAPLVPANSSQPAFHYQPGSCPNAEAAGKRVINLPTYYSLTDQQIEEVIDFIKKSEIGK